MTYISQRKNNTAMVLTVLLFIITAACFVGSYYVSWRGVLQILGVASVTLAIQFTQRYLLTSYEYILNRPEELYQHNNIQIVRIQGKHRRDVCNLTLECAIDFIPAVPLKEAELKYGKITQQISFCADMFPAEAYCLIMEFNGKQLLIRMECDEAFAGAMRERIVKKA